MPETAERPSTSTVRFTYEDHRLYPDDTKRHEIIDGNEYVAPAPNTFHQRIVTRLTTRLHYHAEENDLGEVFTSPIDLIFSDTDVVQPDVLFVAKERAAIVEHHGLTDAPDLVVEVLSESNRRHDEIRKRRLYERYGVREYWIVDPALEQVKVYRRSNGGGFGEKTEHHREHGGTLAPPLLPGLVVSLEELFA
jgi:Uma2 family endonuclease